jgi:Tol biopolymer transport system component
MIKLVAMHWEAAAMFVIAGLFPLAGARGQQPLGVFEQNTDVGPATLAGSTTFDASRERYTIAGAGSNMWDARDEFQFVWKRMTGDFLIRARMKFTGSGTNPHRKIGVIIRQNLEPGSPYVDIAVHGDGLTSMQIRRTAGAETTQIMAPVAAANVVQLERNGNTYTMRATWDGEPFSSEKETEVELGNEVYVGLFACSHDAGEIETAEFDNVRVVVPAADDFVPYRDYIGSNLEIMDVETGVRTVVYRVNDSLQAPNWTADGEALIYNRNGRLYRFNLATREPTEIDTGFATANNNDHVLSFDGTMLAISHHSADDDGQSIIYTLPVGGGIPRRVTPRGPSYLHGWSPDGSELVFTGGRDGNYDIYSIPAGGGEETRLTTYEGLDDGPEYAPDGRHIYFNSARSGRMQIWRMPPGGYEHEQVTDDQFNNWFPHISPDGRRIVFLSFGGDVAADDHPFYKHVYLQMMPYPAGRPRVIAYVYGGQGTINVPSWSPDSKRIAFVSNTAGE